MRNSPNIPSLICNSCASTSWTLAIKMYSKCDDWLIELSLVTNCSRVRSRGWVIPTWRYPALLFLSPCWIWALSPAALFAFPQFSPAASDAPLAGVSRRARTWHCIMNLQNVEEEVYEMDELFKVEGWWAYVKTGLTLTKKTFKHN